MKELHFVYTTKYQFSNLINSHHYSLRIVPMNTERQKIKHLWTEVDRDDKTETVDAFGNHMIIGSIMAPHDTFKFKAEGNVLIDETAFEKDEEPLAIYKYPTKLTAMDKNMREFLNELSERYGYDSMRPYDVSYSIMKEIYSCMEYVQGITDVLTSASEAFKYRKGVCQDYAHIMLAFLRERGITARYVVGMMMGEGVSHAWVEINENGNWYGFDPTNDKGVDGDYIKISHGRDYENCIVSKGHFLGAAEQTQTIEVRVEEVR